VDSSRDHDPGGRDIERRDLRPFLIALGLLLVVYVAGVLYFHFGMALGYVDAIYYATISFSTVGYGAPANMDEVDKLVLSLLLLLGVATTAYTVTKFFTFVVEGEINLFIGHRKMMKAIEALQQHTIICGMGRIGSVVAEQLKASGVDVVIIEGDEKIAEEAIEHGYLVLVGDATQEEILQKAGIERACCLVATLPTDAEVVFLTLTGRFMNPTLRIVARASDKSCLLKLKRAGADVTVMPTAIGGVRMSQAILSPSLLELFEFLGERGDGKLKIDELHLSEGSKLIGETLESSRLDSEFDLILIAHRSRSGAIRFKPDPQSTIEKGDTIVVLGRKEKLDELHRSFESNDGYVSDPSRA